MYKSTTEASLKGLQTKTVKIIRDRLAKSYKEERPEFSCFYHTKLEIGWILYEGNIFIYNSKNVYFDMKLPVNAQKIKASQVIISNTENGDYLLISDDKFVYSRIINEEFDLRYMKEELQTLNQDEQISAVHLMNSPIENIPSLVLATTNGRVLTVQFSIGEDYLKLDELVLETPKRFFKPLTSFFTSTDAQETKIHKIYSEDKLKNKAIIYTIGEKTIQVWTLSNDHTDMWKINVLNSVQQTKSIPGEIMSFRIIGDEIIERDEENAPIFNIIAQVVYKRQNSSKFYTQYYLVRFSIDAEKKTYQDFPTDPLFEGEKELKHEDEEVKCLVVSNIGTVTYVFFCYPTNTRVLNLFREEIEISNLQARIIGSGIMIEKVRNFLLFSDREIIIFSLIRECSFKTLNKFYLKEIEKSNSQRKQIHEANLEGVHPRLKGDDELKVLEMIRNTQGF